ncbi:MAG: nicotinate (nicotinamide) nucleotide adenylyltransferase [Sulfurimonadaceae bacterium]|jgi:nicotinate-nucleotide adenylyltransferase|nr:nicotinate (nicotinamide) nucleotide adenylyltransferase [Sulfurimonadaceae bacterium]
MENVALFGGSFDPPHIGHIAVVEALLQRNEIDGVIIMPAYLNPFKIKVFADASLRIAWLKETFASYKNVMIETYETEQQRKVPTIESVEYLLTKFKKIYLVIGADNLAKLEEWYRYDELKKRVTFMVATREGCHVPQEFLKLDVRCSVSSTELRETIERQKLPKICADKIIKHYKEIDANQN